MVGLRAILLLADDLDRALRFYAEAFDLTDVKRSPDTAALGGELAELTIGGATVWFYTGLPERPKALYPVLILDVHDPEAAKERVERAGGTIVGGLRDDPLGRYYLFRDSEGNILEAREQPTGG
jgi:predicted enzyme related to lactoylglutathione lyase